jgi:hypothetical protein
MCLSKLFLGLFVVVVNVILVAGIIALALNLTLDCDERETSCTAIFKDDKCYIRYNNTSLTDCVLDDYKCATDEFKTNKTFDCYVPFHNTTANECPTIECINEGILTGLIILSIITAVIMVLSCIFLCLGCTF